VTLVVKPKGRGRWSPMTVRIDARRRGLALIVKPGETFSLGGVVWRICAVQA